MLKIHDVTRETPRHRSFPYSWQLVPALARYAPSAILPSDWPVASWAGVIDPQDESRAFWMEA